MMRKSESPLAVGSVGQPAHEGGGGPGARHVAVALSVTGVGVADGIAVRPLRLQVIDRDVKRSPDAFSSNVWASTGRLSVSMNSGSTVESRIA